MASRTTGVSAQSGITSADPANHTLIRVPALSVTDLTEAVYEVHTPSAPEPIGRLVRRRGTLRSTQHGRRAVTAAHPWRAQVLIGDTMHEIDGWYPSRAAALAALLTHLGTTA